MSFIQVFDTNKEFNMVLQVGFKGWFVVFTVKVLKGKFMQEAISFEFSAPNSFM